MESKGNILLLELLETVGMEINVVYFFGWRFVFLGHMNFARLQNGAEISQRCGD